MENYLIKTLEERFKQNMHRHPNMIWDDIFVCLTQNPQVLHAITKMEETLGEPDVFVFDEKSRDIYYVDFSKESPKARVSLCYDEEARASRKQNKPLNSAMKMAKDMDVELLTYDEYKKLQHIEPLDLKTSSWLLTPQAIRSLGGAIFGDRRYDHVFLYHNGADSYYSVRGFRAKVKLT